MDETPVSGPDLALGIAIEDLADGAMLVGHVGEEAVLLARRGDEYFAIGARCSHYGGPLGEGLMVGESVRCPWHHAAFDLRTGAAVRAPALSAVPCWSTEVRDGKVFMRDRKSETAPKRDRPKAQPRRIVIIGGGAAGFAAAEKLRTSGYDGSLVMLSSEDAPPVDRPNLSKDYLAGNAPEDWIPLRPDSFYAERGIDLRLGTKVDRIDVAKREVRIDGAEPLTYDRLLLATGAEPVRLQLPGIERSHVHTLRTLADSRAIIAQAAKAQRAVVMGASFIGLEVAASLRARGLEVHVVAPEKRPMERVLGPELGDFVRALHEEHGVIFHLEDTATAIGEREVQLKSGAKIAAELVVAGVGVRPRIALAEGAGIKVDRGVVVDQLLQTSAPGVFAAGDIVRWPDPHTGEAIRVEHWVVAERQGQTAALNMLDAQQPFDAVPFFWSQHYDVPINYLGHAESWDELTIEGDIAARDCLLRYIRKGRTLAVASIYRDVDNLQAELEIERAVA
jgi:NADPH-dependent 2,4-dienoyl-CoA reductase/sulfur reductase-like enzyme/nitrite reductase/ring-hydroxylating ferredoxin subunit